MRTTGQRPLGSALFFFRKGNKHTGCSLVFTVGVAFATHGLLLRHWNTGDFKDQEADRQRANNRKPAVGT